MNIDSGFIRVQAPASQQTETKPLVAQKSSAQQSVQNPASSDADKVSLSPEGMDKLAEETGAVETGAAESQGGGVADAVIKKLKEQIEAVKQQLQALAGKDGVGEQKKMLQDKLAILNSALLSAMNEQAQV